MTLLRLQISIGDQSILYGLSMRENLCLFQEKRLHTIQLLLQQRVSYYRIFDLK